MHTNRANPHALVSPQLSQPLKRVTLCSRTLGVDVTVRVNTRPLEGAILLPKLYTALLYPTLYLQSIYSLGIIDDWRDLLTTV